MKTKRRIGRSVLVLLTVAAVMILLAGVPTAQIFLRFFSKKPEPVMVSADMLKAYQPTLEEIEAARKIHRDLTDAERVAARKNPQNTTPVSQIKDKKPAAGPCGILTPQVRIQLRFVSCPPQRIAPKGFKTGQGWVFLPSASAQKEPALQRAADWLENEDFRAAAGAVCIQEDYVPTLIRFMDRENTDRVDRVLQEDSRCHVLQSPDTTLSSGETAVLLDTSTRPFTDSLCCGTTKKGETVLTEHPHLDTVSEGVRLYCQPEVLNDGSVRLKRCEFLVRKILDMNHCFQPCEGGIVQIPRVETIFCNVPVTIPKGKTLMVAFPQPQKNSETRETLPTDADGNKFVKKVFCLLLTCEVVQNDQDIALHTP